MDAAIIKKQLFEQYPTPYAEMFVRLLFKADDNGQIDVSIRGLAKEFGISERVVRTFLKKTSDTLVTHQVTHLNTKLTICNYDSYKVFLNSSDTPKDTLVTHQQKKETIPPNDIYISNPFIEKEKADAEENTETKVSSVKEEGETKKNGRFVPPTMDEVRAYFYECGWQDQIEPFYNYYEANGWMVGKNKMKKWKAAAANWNNKNNKYRNGQQRLSTAEQFGQLGQQLATRSAYELEQERNGQGKELPPELQGWW